MGRRGSRIVKRSGSPSPSAVAVVPAHRRAASAGERRRPPGPAPAASPARLIPTVRPKRQSGRTTKTNENPRPNAAVQGRPESRGARPVAATAEIESQGHGERGAREVRGESEGARREGRDGFSFRPILDRERRGQRLDAARGFLSQREVGQGIPAGGVAAFERAQGRCERWRT